ncbi:MAG TPA: ABC transporter permease [Vicinamibacterales bacterium]|jgi:putative ABC transport system permease protein|nr:ABC transporter permease [Vicinamibacterales bacterium]
MRNWETYVRDRLSLPGLAPAREARIIREIAAQLEDFYQDAIARGLGDAEADAFACAQIDDWRRMAQDLWLVDRPNARPRLERAASAIGDIAGDKRRGLRMIADLLHDMRFAVRQFSKTPVFTIVATLTIALGIGANTAIFSVVNGVLLRPLPYADPDRLVRVYEITPRFGRFSVAPATFLDWRRESTALRIAAYDVGSATLAQDGMPERVTNVSVSWDLFDLLGVKPVLGRAFVQDEDVAMKNQVIIISHGMWQRRFGGDRGVINRTLVLSEVPYTIVGVMPAGFEFPSPEAEYWVPLGLETANAPRGAHYLGVVARIKDGTTIEQAHAEIKTITERLARQHPQSKDESGEVVGLHEQIVGEIRPALLTLVGAVGVVVLIACGNVANLLLVRASVRNKEIAIRTALGAGRRRIVTQMLAESLVLAFAGGAIGLLLAYGAIGPLQALNAGSIPRIDDVAIDGRVLAFTLLLCGVTGILFGLVPAWQASRPNVSEAIKEGGRNSIGSGGRWLRNGLVMMEVAFSVVLLVGAALLLRSFSRLTSVDPGFSAENVLTFRVGLPRTSYKEDAQREALFAQLLERLRGLPRVTAAGMIQSLPIRDSYFLSFSVQGRPAAAGTEPSANYRVASPGYFEALGIPIRQGRTFTDRDAAGAPMVAIVDEAFARRYFPGAGAIGQRIDVGNGTDGFYEIVGLVGDVRYGGLDATPEPTMYIPYKQDVFSTMWIVARTDGDPTAIASNVRGLLRDLDRNLPAFSMSPLADVVSESLDQRRFSVLLLGLFATIALLLAAVGLYGVISYSVSQRTQEIGVRLAIGAPRSRLLGMVVGQGMKLVIAGIVLGLAGALALARLVSTLLFEVTPFDPPSYASTVIALVAVAALACYVPARRAMRVDPITALRCS